MEDFGSVEFEYYLTSWGTTQLYVDTTGLQ